MAMAPGELGLSLGPQLGIWQSGEISASGTPPAMVADIPSPFPFPFFFIFFFELLFHVA